MQQNQQNQQNQLPKSAKELNRILLDYNINCIEGGFANPPGLTDFLEQKANTEDAPEMAKLFLKLFSNPGEKLAAFARYFSFRSDVNVYQQDRNISSVYWETVEWRGEKLRFPTLADQLTTMPQDIAICQRHHNKTINKFLDFCDRHKLPLFPANDYGCADSESPLSQQQVRDMAKNYQYSWLGSSFPQYTPVSSSETDKILYWIEDYTLFLVEDENISTTVYAQLKFMKNPNEEQKK